MASIRGTMGQAETLQPEEKNPWLKGHEGLQTHDWNGEHEKRPTFAFFSNMRTRGYQRKLTEARFKTDKVK